MEEELDFGPEVEIGDPHAEKPAAGETPSDTSEVRESSDPFADVPPLAIPITEEHPLFARTVAHSATNPADSGYNFDDLDDIMLDTQSMRPETETRCEFITGVAGSGKSYRVLEAIRQDPKYAVLAASTGIAAVNLNAVTINSLLGFFDTASLKDAYIQGSAQRKLRRFVEEGYQNIVLDEISMVSDEMLDILVRVFDSVNQNLAHGQSPIGLIASGDFCQLAPIPDRKSSGGRAGKTPWAFDAACWPRFAANTVVLTKVWRQSDPTFLAALNHARAGQGAPAAAALEAAGCKWENMVDTNFDGTTLKGRNEEVDRHNNLSLDRVVGRKFALPSRRWGKLRTEWKNIPEQTILRENAYVMLLANKYADGGGFLYANGDCGHIRQINPSTVPGEMPSVTVELVRNGAMVNVTPIVRGVEYRDKPDGMSVAVNLKPGEDLGRFLPKPHYRGQARVYVEGQVEFYPVRLAYASTVHKCQGLSLDKVQIDFRDWTMKNPAMTYVSLSRCRTAEGLRLVGSRERLAEHCKIDQRIKGWL